MGLKIEISFHDNQQKNLASWHRIRTLRSRATRSLNAVEKGTHVRGGSVGADVGENRGEGSASQPGKATFERHNAIDAGDGDVNEECRVEHNRVKTGKSCE